MDNARRHVALMVWPLAVIALGLFAAVLVPYGTPMKWLAVTSPITEPTSPFNLIYVGAGLLAASLWRAARRGETPGHITTVIAVLTTLGATVMTAWSAKIFSTEGYWKAALVFTAPVALAVVLVFNALRMRGWDRALLLLGSFAIAALPFSCPLVPGMFNVFSGGVLYLAAVVTILALFVRGTFMRAEA